MARVKIISNLNECRDIWQSVMPSETMWDLWEVRASFQRHFRRQPYFIVVENGLGIAGVLPLSYIPETDTYVCFPGETWEGKTWLEQNRVIAADAGVYRMLLAACPIPHHLRYLVPPDFLTRFISTVDEIGYHFIPPMYDYSMDRYFEVFSHKTAKRLRRELDELQNRVTEIRYDAPSDFDLMVRMNVERYGTFSYFYDPRFRESFRCLASHLQQAGRLRMTTVIMEGLPAAVDMGCVYNNTYSVLAGGTSAAFPGVAKLINTTHMRRACEERYDTVDFLCGDFSWKTMFHLSPRPLFMLSSVAVEVARPLPVHAVEARSAVGG